MLERVLTELLDPKSLDALERLWWRGISAKDLEAEIGQLSALAQPAYLPFAYASEVALALYLRPGDDWRTAPVVRLDRDNKDVRIAARRLVGVRAALFVEAGTWLPDWDEAMSACDDFGAGVSTIAPLSDAFRAQVRKLAGAQIGLWSSNASPATRELWAAGDLEHPFAGAPNLDYDAARADAEPVVESFVAAQPPAPELLSLLLCMHARGGRAPDARDVDAVLGAEAWRDRGLIVEGAWRISGYGLCEWDATLRAAAKTDGALEGPFERMQSHPRLYSGDDDEAVDVLVEVARDFERAGDWETALNQYRNAAAVAGLSGEYLGRVTRDEVCEAIANACDRIQPDSLAAELARASARAFAAGL